MIIDELLSDIATTCQAAFPSLTVQIGIPDANRADINVVFVLVESLANAREREPLGDSPYAPGDYDVGVRYHVGVPIGQMPGAYNIIEGVYLWSQSQMKRHSSLYYYSRPTAVEFAINGDIIIGTWTVIYRVRRARG